MPNDYDRVKELAIRRALEAYRRTLVEELGKRPPAEIFEGLRKTQHHHRALLIMPGADAAAPPHALLVRALFVFDDDEIKVAEALSAAGEALAFARAQLAGRPDDGSA